MDVTVCVASFGGREWRELAESRAVPSALPQAPVIRVHGDTLHAARNAALEQVETEWVIHLDADDELESGYVAAMGRATADVRAPLVRYVRGGRPRPLWQPRVAGHRHDCEAACLRAGNWVVVGAAVRTDLLRSVGWHDFAWSEDWATWALCAKAGATFGLVRDAIYRAHVRPDSRNRGASQRARLAAHRQIEAFVWPDEATAA